MQREGFKNCFWLSSATSLRLVQQKRPFIVTRRLIRTTPIKAEAVTEEIDFISDQYGSVTSGNGPTEESCHHYITSDQYIAVSALGTAMHPQRSSFHYWRLSSVQSGENYLPCSQVTVLLPLMRCIW